MKPSVTSQSVLCHTQAQRLKAVVDVWLRRWQLKICRGMSRYLLHRSDRVNKLNITAGLTVKPAQFAFSFPVYGDKWALLKYRMTHIMWRERKAELGPGVHAGLFLGSKSHWHTPKRLCTTWLSEKSTHARVCFLFFSSWKMCLIRL